MDKGPFAQRYGAGGAAPPAAGAAKGRRNVRFTSPAGETEPGGRLEAEQAPEPRAQQGGSPGGGLPQDAVDGGWDGWESSADESMTPPLVPPLVHDHPPIRGHHRRHEVTPARTRSGLAAKRHAGMPPGAFALLAGAQDINEAEAAATESGGEM